MRLLPHIRKRGSRWLCTTCWLPEYEGAGATPREAYDSWKQVHFAVHPSVVVQALWAYRERSRA